MEVHEAASEDRRPRKISLADPGLKVKFRMQYLDAANLLWISCGNEKQLDGLAYP